MKKTLLTAAVAAATALAAVTASAVGLDPARITGLTEVPTDAGDAANKAYVDSAEANATASANQYTDSQVAGLAGVLDNVLRVSAGGGDFTTIGDALASLQGPDAPSVDNKWVIVVGPGVYEEAIDLPSYTSLVGAGGGTTCATTIRRPADAATGTPVVRVESRSEVRDLCIESENAADVAIGALVAAGQSTMENVSVSVSGSVAQGIMLATNAVLRGSGLRVSAEGATAAIALHSNGATPIIQDSTFVAGPNAPQTPSEAFVAVLVGGSSETFLSGVTADGGQSALALDYQPGGGVVLASRLLGNVLIRDGATGVILNGVIQGAVADGNTGFRNCRGNYGIVPGTPADSGSSGNTAASYEGGGSSNFFGEVGC